MVPTRQDTRSARLYLLGVIALGTAATLEAVSHLARNPIDPQWLILPILTAVTSPLALRVSLTSAKMSVSDTFVFTAVFLFGPAAGVLTAAVDGLVISLWLRQKRDVVRVLFNTTAPALAMWFAAHVYVLMEPARASGPAAHLMLPVAVVATLYFLLNSWFVTLAIANGTGASPFELWRQHFLGIAVNYFGAASVAVLLVGLNRQVTLDAVLAIVPLLVISHLTIKTTQKRVEEADQHLTELRELHRSTIETLAMAVDAKDQITHGHIRRVQTEAVALGRALGIEKNVLQAIEAAALLHDMGKLSVPEHILNKPGKLTAAEFDIMKRHAGHGADMLSAIKFPYPVVPIVRHHHEQWNGQGYPSGLKGTDIPIGARILSVVDCFDALTSDRPYRPRLSDAEALAILKERRGSFYDPDVVDAFFQIYPTIAAGRPDLSSSADAELPRELPVDTAVPGSGSDQYGRAARFSAAELLYDVDGSPDLARALDVLIAHLTRFVPAALTVAYVPDPTSDELLALCASGQSAAHVAGTRMLVGQRISGWVAANRQSILNSDPLLDLGDVARMSSPSLQRCMSMPLVHGVTLLGVITFYAPRSVELTEHHCQVVEAALAGVAPAIKLRADRAAASDSREQYGVDRRRPRVDNASRHAGPGLFGVH